MNHGGILTVLILALAFTGCSYWSEADRRRLEKLSEAIERNPNDPALIETLESGMRSEEHFRAKDHIFAAGDLSQNPRVRAALVSVIEDRIFGDDPWTARVCAEQLPLIARPNEVGSRLFSVRSMKWSGAGGVVEALVSCQRYHVAAPVGGRLVLLDDDVVGQVVHVGASG